MLNIISTVQSNAFVKQSISLLLDFLALWPF